LNPCTARRCPKNGTKNCHPATRREKEMVKEMRKKMTEEMTGKILGLRNVCVKK